MSGKDRNKVPFAKKKKEKLRTAADCISRLRWSTFDDGGDLSAYNCEHDNNNSYLSNSAVIIGYDDRINGPLEKALEDFTPILQGGDIPEHRIWYLRRQTTLGNNNEDDIYINKHVSKNKDIDAIKRSILWDRIGRFDFIFSSGNGADRSYISTETIHNVQLAIQTMKRLEDEKQERKQQKEKMRARRARQRVVKAALVTPVGTKTAVAEKEKVLENSITRHLWTPSPSFTYSKNAKGCWVVEKSHATATDTVDNHNQQGQCTNQRLSVATWNVLFDVFDGYGDEESTLHRWKQVVLCLQRSDIDIIALQEVTPRFASMLLSQPWVTDNYASSASPSELSTVSPFGNLLLWRQNKLKVIEGNGLFSCLDGTKRRSLVSAFQMHNENNPRHETVILFANVHLLADGIEKGTGKRKCRGLARRRELSAVIGQLQRLEEAILHQSRKEKRNANIKPLIVGDFNTPDQQKDPIAGLSSIANGFVDAWPIICKGRNGYTFDPRTNVLAARSRELVNGSDEPKRIDRIYVCRNSSHDATGGRAQLTLDPVSGDLLGAPTNNGHINKQYSDHYGVLINFSVATEANTLSKIDAALYHPITGKNTWAANALPTPDTLLAIVFDDPILENLTVGSSSTLPVPHITLLHGFVELSSEGSLALTVKAIQDAIDLTRIQMTTNATSKPWSVAFSNSSLDVFEHQSSATLVARPDCERQGDWMHLLYQALVASFSLCHEQTNRHGGHWNPHVSLGSFGTSHSARMELSKIIQNDRWYDFESKTSHRVPVFGVTVFQRSQMDGKFSPVVSVPVAERNSKGINKFLEDAGSKASHYMKGLCVPVVSEVKRACHEVFLGHRYLSAEVRVYGSLAMDVALPGISDVDAVIQLKFSSPNAIPPHSNEVLSDIASWLQSRHKAKFRIRGAGDFNVLTVKLYPAAPAVDLALCWTDTAMHPIDTNSARELATVRETEAILDSLIFSEQTLHHASLIKSAFKGSVRIIKFWAHRRNIYGANIGFLGGGSWAVLLAHVMCEALKNESFLCNVSGDLDNSFAKVSQKMATLFFLAASEKWGSSPFIVTSSLHHRKEDEELTMESRRLIETATSRDTIVVLSPTSRDNYGRNSSRSTTKAIRDEFKRAALILQSKQKTSNNPLVEVLQPMTVENFAALYPSYILYEITVIDKGVIGGMPIADARGYGAFRILRLVVDLENGKYQLRPLPNPLKRKVVLSSSTKYTFVWLIGLDTAVANHEVQTFLNKHSSEEDADFKRTSTSLSGGTYSWSLQTQEETLLYIKGSM